MEGTSACLAVGAGRAPAAEKLPLRLWPSIGWRTKLRSSGRTGSDDLRFEWPGLGSVAWPVPELNLPLACCVSSKVLALRCSLATCCVMVDERSSALTVERFEAW